VWKGYKEEKVLPKPTSAPSPPETIAGTPNGKAEIIITALLKHPAAK
jgi:hypothetical protein